MTGTRRAIAKAAKRDRASRRWAFLADRQGSADVAALNDAVGAKLAAAPGAKGFPADAPSRWVPIGPSVVRRGQGTGRPRVTGRVRALAISDDGSRVYAASARGGLWYSADAGLSWSPVGGWAERNVGTGGPNSALACGALLVAFGATAADDDVVLVGTGETVPWTDATTGSWGGVGILAGTFRAPTGLDVNPWEVESGLTLLQGRGVFRLVREPGARPGSTDPADHRDRVLAATSQGLVMGTRTAGPPDHYVWSQVAGLDTAAMTATEVTHHTPLSVTDVVWYPSGRIVAAVSGKGLYRSDDGGTSFAPVAGCNVTTHQRIAGRMSIARPYDSAAGGLTNGLFVLCGVRSAHGGGEGTPTLYSIADATVAAPVVTSPTGVPSALWPNQMAYDQALWVEHIGAADRVYLGGSFYQTGGANSTFDAALWCFDVTPPAPPAHPTARLTGVPGLSTPADGSPVAGMIGTGVHADVHAIALVGDAAHRQVWVGCDGGVYRSAAAGKVNTFAHRGNGLAVLEPGWSAAHPTVSHLAVAGMQDNGTQLRTGDTVWEEVFEGDGGGVVFDPAHPYRFVGQYTYASWSASPSDGQFCGPTSKWVNGGDDTHVDPESSNTRSAFYSGAATTTTPTGTTRLAIGTNRVWLTDDLGANPRPNTWKVLPFATHATAGHDPRPHAPVHAAPWWIPPDNQPGFGVPSAGLGLVITMRWASPTVLIVMYEQGVATYWDHGGTWTATVDVLDFSLGTTGTTTLTDIAVIPGTTDYYLTTTGHLGDPVNGVAPDTTLDTCYLLTRTTADPTLTNPPIPTGLRHALDTTAPVTVGPLDPAYAVAVDPVAPHDVYIGTVTGVWRGVRDLAAPAAGPALKFHDPADATLVNPFVNGLPQAAVQDLTIHHDPAHPTTRLLRASIQARGVWEVDLAAPDGPSLTYLRVHPYDDRRRLPTPMANPRSEFSSDRMYDGDSPDIVVRPVPPVPAAAPPSWQGAAADRWGPGNAPTYELWTFQTAFRWLYPTVQATGEWTPEFGALVAFHRAQQTGPLVPAGPVLDQQLWDLVMATRITAAGSIAGTTATDRHAVYQPPWATPAAMTAPATEVDIAETVVPVMSVLGTWTVHAEPCTVDVLLHHRDTRAVAADHAYGVLLWRKIDDLSDTPTTFDADALTVFFRACASSGTMHAPPSGWTAAGPAVGQPVTSLPVPLDARMPRALSFDVDLTDTFLKTVELLAVVWDESGRLTIDPAVPGVTTIADYVRGWPYAAYRSVMTAPRLP